MYVPYMWSMKVSYSNKYKQFLHPYKHNYHNYFGEISSESENLWLCITLIKFFVVNAMPCISVLQV